MYKFMEFIRKLCLIIFWSKLFLYVNVWVGAASDLFNFISLSASVFVFFCQNFTIMVKRLYNPPRTTPREEKHRDTEKQTLQLSRHSDHVLWIFFFFVSLMCAHPLSCIRRRCCGCMCRPCHLVAPTGSANAMVRVTSRQFALHLLFLFLEKKKAWFLRWQRLLHMGSLHPACFFFCYYYYCWGFFFQKTNCSSGCTWPP